MELGQHTGAWWESFLGGKSVRDSLLDSLNTLYPIQREGSEYHVKFHLSLGSWKPAHEATGRPSMFLNENVALPVLPSLA